MGLWGKIKNGANKAKKKAEEAKRKADEFARRKAREAKEKAERKAKEAALAAERKAQEARRRAEQATRAAQRAFEEALERTTDPMERLALKAERAIKEGMSEMDVKKMLQEELGKMKDGLKREVIDELKSEVADPIQNTFENRIPEFVTKALPAALKQMAKDLQGIATGPVGNVIFGIAEKAAPGKTTHAIGFVELEIEVRDKIKELRKWIAKPPTSGRDVERMCWDFVGDDVVVVRPMRILEMIPTFPKMPIDPAIPVQVKDIPGIVEQVEGAVKDIL